MHKAWIFAAILPAIAALSGCGSGNQATAEATTQPLKKEHDRGYVIDTQIHKYQQAPKGFAVYGADAQALMNQQQTSAGRVKVAIYAVESTLGKAFKVHPDPGGGAMLQYRVWDRAKTRDSGNRVWLMIGANGEYTGAEVTSACEQGWEYRPPLGYREDDMGACVQ